MKKFYYSSMMALLIYFQSFAGDSTQLKAPDSHLRSVISDSLRKHRKVRLDLYVMSMCPFGTRAENTLIPILKEKGDSIEFNVFFIADESPEVGFQSLHGRREVLEDRRQLVIARHFPERLIDYLRDRTMNISSPQWYASATAASLNVDSIDELTYTAEEINAFSANIAFSKQNKISASPSLFINGVAYKGSFTVSSGVAMADLRCTGGLKDGQPCLIEDSQIGCSQCAGGTRDGKDCDGSPNSCPGTCMGGPQNGDSCGEAVFCKGNCTTPFTTIPCSTNADCLRCDGGLNDGDPCDDTHPCLGFQAKCRQTTCIPAPCIGTCITGTCKDVGGSSCCLQNGGCVPGITSLQCTSSGSGNHWSPSGNCGTGTCTATTASVPSLRGAYTADAKSVQISWRLEAGMDNAGFTIDRSRNGERFNEIGYAPMDAGSNGTFTFTDIEPFPVGYYRLTFSKNDQLAYSQVITVVSFEKNNLVLQPNPATGKVSILFTNMQLYTTSVSFFDLSGRQVLTHNLSPGESEVNISNLPQGIYIVKATQNGKIYTGKLEKN